ncbi:hypothetical protein [Nitrobacter sp.]|uniref:hypothetical protein n=1 Tax=Nitrobacter sp. TaxID=29420 RepID=UPI0032207E7A
MIKVKLPLYLSWKQLKQLLGWPYSRAHTWRMMFDPRYSGDPFPLCGKVGSNAHRNSHPMWYTPQVLDYFKRHGLTVPDDIEFA